MPKFIVTTLGCKVNQYESAAIAQTLRDAGLVDDDGTAPVALCVVHTCCVTSVAARKSRQLIRRLVSRHPQARVVVTGCYATGSAEKLLQIPGVTAVAGHADDVAGCLRRTAAELRSQTPASDTVATERAGCGEGGNQRTRSESNAASGNLNMKPFFAPQVKHFRPSTARNRPENDPADEQALPGTTNLSALADFPGRHRAMVKVQDGCDGFCSYCIVAHMRRRLYSRPVDQTLSEIDALVQAGYREIVLCGVNLGAFGRDTVHRTSGEAGPDRLAELIETVARRHRHLRLRLSSLSPVDITEQLLDVMACNDNVCKHLHLALQSGSTAILDRMERRYTAEQFCRTIDRIRDRLPRSAVTTDVIVGFPGESEADFEATMQVARHAGFAKMHIFPYSPREGTKAARWTKDRPAGDVVKRRCRQLAALAEELAADYRQQFVGREVQVMLEEPVGDAEAVGVSERYLRVRVGGVDPDQMGRIVPVRITGGTDDGLVGRFVSA